MPDINDVRAGEAAISKDTLYFIDWMVQRPNKNDNMDILKSLQSYAAYLEQKSPKISSLNKDEQFYALRKVFDRGPSVSDMKTILPESKVPSNSEQLNEIASALNHVMYAVWRNTSFADLKAGRISDEGTMAKYMAKLVSIENTVQNAQAKETTKQATAQPEHSEKDSFKQSMQADGKTAKIQEWLNQVKLPKDMATQLCDKYGVEAAYKIVQQSMLAPKNAMEAMGESYRNSKGAIEYFANLDDAKAKTVDIEKLTAANKTKPDELYGAKEPSNREAEAPVSSVTKEDAVLTTPIPEKELFSQAPTMKQPDLTSKSPEEEKAEQKYEKLLARKRRRSGDEKAYLTAGDLLDAGVDVSKDFQTALAILNINGKHVPEELFAAFPNRDAAVTKDVAVMSLIVMNARRKDKQLYAEFQNKAEQSRSNPTLDRKRLHEDMQIQTELVSAQWRVNGQNPSDKESTRFDDAIAARKAKDVQIDKNPMQLVDVALVAKGQSR